MKNIIPQLTFPPYEKLKSLPKDRQYIFSLFNLGFNFCYGRFTLYEDFHNIIRFDLMVDGYSETNGWRTCYKFNKGNYKKICDFAQECYDHIYLTLVNSTDYSWSWEHYWEDNNAFMA